MFHEPDGLPFQYVAQRAPLSLVLGSTTEGPKRCSRLSSARVRACVSSVTVYECQG